MMQQESSGVSFLRGLFEGERVDEAIGLREKIGIGP